MIKSRIAVAGALMALAGAASAAGFTVTPAVVSDYDWRGISQTEWEQDGDVAPAFQLGLNYGFENGLYVGAWGSNVKFGPSSIDDSNVELDVFAGYAGGDSAEGIGYDVGINTYNYPGGPSADKFWEGYAGISHGMFSAKVWYSPNFSTTSSSSLYVEGNVTYPLPANFSLIGHVGYSSGDGVKDYYGDSYVDYGVGVGYTISNFSLSVKYIDTNLDHWKGDKVVAGVSTTFPWPK